MATVKFSTQDINTFNDRIQNVLQNQSCCDIFCYYLKRNSPANFNAFNLWKKANNIMGYNEDDILDSIDNVDGFNIDPLLTMAEPEDKLGYIKQECCRILESIRSNFITYLRKYHM